MLIRPKVNPWTGLVDYAIQKCGKYIKMLYGLLCINSRLHPKNKILPYKVVIGPILLYAAPIFSNCAQTHQQRIQILQSRILKMCLSLPWRYSTNQLHDDAEIEMIQSINERFTQNFIDRCNAVSNPLINDLYSWFKRRPNFPLDHPEPLVFKNEF